MYMFCAIASLLNFKIVQHKLKITKLQTNSETGIQFRNYMYVALLRIFEIALFLKQTPPINAITACSAQCGVLYCIAATYMYNSVKWICTFP